MNDDEIKNIIKNGNLLLLKNDKNEFFWYYNEYKILIPYEQENITKQYDIDTYVK